MQPNTTWTAPEGLDARFDVVRMLGAGAFGTVYEVRDVQRDISLALKSLHKLDASAIFRFKQEFRALTRLSHPNLVRLYELFRMPSGYAFTMELVEGCCLDEVSRSSAQTLARDAGLPTCDASHDETLDGTSSEERGELAHTVDSSHHAVVSALLDASSTVPGTNDGVVAAGTACRAPTMDHQDPFERLDIGAVRDIFGQLWRGLETPAWVWSGASRPEAVQRHADGGQSCGAAGLRDGSRAHVTHGRVCGHTSVHGARATALTARSASHRLVCLWRHALRRAHRPAPLLGQPGADSSRQVARGLRRSAPHVSRRPGVSSYAVPRPASRFT